MRIFFLSIITALFLTTQVFSKGVEIGFGVGYGFTLGGDKIYLGSGPTSGPIYMSSSTEKEVIDSNGYPSYVCTEYNDLYKTLGNGIKADLNITFFFNETIGLMFASGISLLGGFKSENTLHYLDGTKREYNRDMSAIHIPINIGIKLKAEYSNFIPFLYIAPGLYIPIGVTVDGTRKNPGEPDYNTTRKYKFAPGFGITAGVGGIIRVGDRLGLKLEVTPTYASARIKEMTYKYESGGVQYTSKEIYEKNEKNLKESTSVGNTYTRYLHGIPKFPFHSIAAKAGIVLALW